jgi:hypothetical protein
MKHETSEQIDPAALAAAYLERLRRRVRWQAEAAAQLRRGEPTTDMAAPPAPPLERPLGNTPPDPEAEFEPDYGRRPVSLIALERLLELESDPARVEEWRYTLLELRRYTGIDCVVPPEFRELVSSIFGTEAAS